MGTRIKGTASPAEGSHDAAFGAKDAAQHDSGNNFQSADAAQLEADAVTIGIPSMRAKTVHELRGVGKKFSGKWYAKKVKHIIDESGYRCETSYQRNAVGGNHPSAGKSKGKQNTKQAAASSPGGSGSGKASNKKPPMVTVDANTGKRM